jgi:integrase
MRKGGKTSHVPLSDRAKTLLRSFDSFLDSPYVFPSVRDPLKPLCADSFLRNIYSPALRKAEIQGACWHTLRHTAASRRIMAGADLFSVKEVLGHRDIETTLRYAQLAPQHMQDTINMGCLGAGLILTGTKTGTTGTASSEAGSVQPIDSLVRPTGLEPVTPRSVVWCSIH